MNWLIQLILTFLEALRRLWQRITARRPIPVPVRANRFTPPSHPFSLSFTDFRTLTPGTRRGRVG